VLALKERVRHVRVAAELRRYVVEIVRRTRVLPAIQLGCGPRASIALAGAAKALALFEGEEYVRPEHLIELAVPVLAHRMVLDPQAKFAGTTAAALVAGILREGAGSGIGRENAAPGLLRAAGRGCTGSPAARNASPSRAGWYWARAAAQPPPD